MGVHVAHCAVGEVVLTKGGKIGGAGKGAKDGKHITEPGADGSVDAGAAGDRPQRGKKAIVAMMRRLGIRLWHVALAAGVSSDLVARPKPPPRQAPPAVPPATSPGGQAA
jgi:hypothetical protein